jgi:uncharacterized membrane protein
MSLRNVCCFSTDYTVSHPTAVKTSNPALMISLCRMQVGDNNEHVTVKMKHVYVCIFIF